MQPLHPQVTEIPFVIFETVSDDPIRFCDTTGPFDFGLGVQNRYLLRVFRFSQSRLSPQFLTIAVLPRQKRKETHDDNRGSHPEGHFDFVSMLFPPLV